MPVVNVSQIKGSR